MKNWKIPMTTIIFENQLSDLIRAAAYSRPDWDDDDDDDEGGSICSLNEVR